MAGFTRHLSRYKEIAEVLSKYGFNDLVSATGYRKEIPFFSWILKNKPDKEIANLSRWERARLALEALGPTFIKFGQIMSNRPDLLPEELIFELEKLQDDVPTLPFEEIKKIIEKELGAPLTEFFATFDEKPIAGASLAQVHTAVLIGGGEVVVKVQRPNVVQQLQKDLRIMKDLAGLFEKYARSKSSNFSPVEIIKNFEESVKRELNFTTEAINILRFQVNFKGEEQIIHVPRVYMELTTPRVIVMEYVKGIKISHIDKLYAAGLDTYKVAQLGTELMFKQIFIHGFFHADPHPGNILVLPDSRICYLDYGMMGSITHTDRHHMGSVFIGIESNDIPQIMRALHKLSGSTELKDEKLLEYKLKDIIDHYKLLSVKEINLSTLMLQLKSVLVEHNVNVPPDFYLFVRAVTIIEGVSLKLYPAYNVFDELRPYIHDLMKKRLSPTALVRDWYYSAFELLDYLKKLPFEAEEILHKLKEGQIHIQFEHKNLENIERELDFASNRLSIAIIIAATIVGSSLIILSGLPPVWNELPVIGLIGFIIAGLLGFGLVISMIRGGKWK